MEEERPTALGILKESLLLSNGELLPLFYIGKDGEPVDCIEKAFRLEVQYNDCRYNFSADDVDRFTVH